MQRLKASVIIIRLEVSRVSFVFPTNTIWFRSEEMEDFSLSDVLQKAEDIESFLTWLESSCVTSAMSTGDCCHILPRFEGFPIMRTFNAETVTVQRKPG